MSELIYKRCQTKPSKPEVPGMATFIDELESAHVDRNDLLHALPVLHGLHRRRTSDLAHVRDFFKVDDLAEVTATLRAASGAGNQLLYHDGGDAVRRWHADQD
ncbi:MAG: hypothetical protein ACRCYU_00915 [Nocardioides sp.]